MKKYNCIVVFDKTKEHILFCKRVKNPYKGLYNFVGGKVEPGEDSDIAAYRELQEETGITKQDIRLFRFMDLTYYYQDFLLELYVGQLDEVPELQPEINPLVWLPLTEDFTDPMRFAGEQNIAHIINVAMKYPLDHHKIQCEPKGLCIGVDGCRGGWIAAVLAEGELRIERYNTLGELITVYPDFDRMYIDMVIGLVSSADDVRPDSVAKKLLRSRSSTIFPIPCRQAVYAEDEASMKAENIRVLGKSLAKQTINIIPKIREVDEFFNAHPEYKNRIDESHPEVCFARLNGEVLLTKKATAEGIYERQSVLSRYLKGIDLSTISSAATSLGCKTDDVMDALCLAVSANLGMQGFSESIPSGAGMPMVDENGLIMRMTIPKV